MSLCRQRRRRHGNVVQEAEAQSAVAFGVVTGRSYQDKSNPITATLECSNGFEATPSSAAGCSERVGPGVGVGVEVASALVAERVELGEVVGRVHTGKILERSFGGSDELDLVVEIKVAHAIHDGKYATLLFGM